VSQDGRHQRDGGDSPRDDSTGTTGELADLEQLILELLADAGRDGLAFKTLCAEVEARAGAKRTTVYGRVRALATAGLVESHRHGHWRQAGPRLGPGR